MKKNNKLTNHISGVDSVTKILNKDFPCRVNQNQSKDFEIESSLYYLGRALFRYSLLKQERSK